MCQFQAADDEFFLPDDEVICLKHIKWILSEYLGLFLGWSSKSNRWFLSQVNASEPKKVRHVKVFLRRIPNVGHAISGYLDSLQSFYLSVSDVSQYFMLLI